MFAEDLQNVGLDGYLGYWMVVPSRYCGRSPVPLCLREHRSASIEMQDSGSYMASFIRRQSHDCHCCSVFIYEPMYSRWVEWLSR